jgi:hypothetical protein
LLEIRINEVVSNNEGVWVDEAGETDDYIELINAGSTSYDLGQFTLEDSSNLVLLPQMTIEPKQVVLLWADNEREQGLDHLPLKINAAGERLTLRRIDETQVDQVDVPALAEHHAYLRIPDANGAFSDCGWATPGKLNGAHCGPAPLPDLSEETTWAAHTWPSPWPARPEPMALTELALRPAGFVEVLNTSSTSIDLTQYRVSVAAHRVGQPWPSSTDGATLAWPAQLLDVGQRLAVAVTEPEVASVESNPNFEGVVTLWSVSDGEVTVVDREGFSYYPPGTALARVPDPDGPFRFCLERSPGQRNDLCAPLAERATGDHVRGFNTPGDFVALAAGRGQVGAAAVEFIDDLASGDVVTFLNSADWDIHYSFVREVIQGLPHMDRCIPEQQAEFNRGWYEFSRDEYFTTEGRHYLLGNLVAYAGSNLHTVEFTPGDVISPEQMLHAFQTVLRHVSNPTEWALRPQDPSQVQRMRQIEGQVPIVDTNAPFRGQSFQPLVPTVGYGTLRYVAADAIESSDLGPRDILITDQVPNTIPFVAGLITEAFQTPLSHVNVLSRGRGTPNMGLKGARENVSIAPLIGKLVRLEVRASDFVIEEADPAEAVTFWDSRQPNAPAAIPRLDTAVRGLQLLAEHSLVDIPSLGAKAAQLAELGRVSLCTHASATGLLETRVPQGAFAIPVVYSLEHLEKSGAKARLAELRRDPAFAADPDVRQRGLAELQDAILTAPVDDELLAAVRERVNATWPGQSVRFRSSSNTEDLADFNGAGLYTSEGIDAGATGEQFASVIRLVWASLWNLRAYDEREYYRIDQDAVAMAVLVHEGFPSEKANGVAISRHVLEPSRGDKYYINAQIGEALVTNPAPGVASDEFTYALQREPHIERFSRSSLSDGTPVLTDDESYWVACNLWYIHEHFRPLVDPEKQNSWFAMDIEFKLMGPERQLVIKQARPYSFGHEAPSGWCDL